MPRRFEGGVIVGEVDLPVGSLRDWVRREQESAIGKCNVFIDSPVQLMDNATLNGRINALGEVLREIDRRADATV